MTGTADDVTYAFNYNMANQVTAKGLSNQTYQWNAPFDKAETAVPNGLNQYETVSQGGLVYDLSYDDNGSLTGDGVWSYTYDVENRLTNAVGPGVAAVYEYDPLGRRSKKSGTGTATEVYLSDGVEEIGDYAANGTTILRRYVHGPGVDEPIVMYTGSGTAQKSYYHANWQGSVVAMTNSTGTATDIYVYSPYGEVDDPTGNPFRYTGRRLDAETGLYYYRARMYSPIIGRFLQTDPVGYGDGLNMYAYVGNDPVNGRDPDGRIGLFGAIVGGLIDATLQLATIAIDDNASISDFSFTSVAISAVAGAAGVWLATSVSKLGKIGTLAKAALSVAADAGISAGSTALKGGDVTLQGVALDVVAGQTVGKALGKGASNKVANSSQQSIRNRQSSRLQRIGDKPNARPAQKARADAARRIVNRPAAAADAKAALVGSNAASGAAKLAGSSTKEEGSCQ